MIQTIYVIGTGLATTGLIGVGVGTLILACGSLFIIAFIINLMPMPGVKCPTCASRGIEQWVLPGKHCPNCSTACRHMV